MRWAAGTPDTEELPRPAPPEQRGRARSFPASRLQLPGPSLAGSSSIQPQRRGAGHGSPGPPVSPSWAVQSATRRRCLRPSWKAGGAWARLSHPDSVMVRARVLPAAGSCFIKWDL